MLGSVNKRMTPPRILVVEDDPDMRRFYERFFSELYPGEFSGSVAADAAEALEWIKQGPPDVVVVDWVLPGISGVELIRALRAHPKTRGLGILMVTGRGDPDSAVHCLESGADDHVAKPVDDRVLAARLRSILRRRELTRELHDVYRLPGLVLDPQANLLKIDGRTVRLAPKELDLMLLFLSRPNIVLALEFLWDRVWGYESDNWHHVLLNTVSRLRAKLGSKWGSRLDCYRKKGYVFAP